MPLASYASANPFFIYFGKLCTSLAKKLLHKLQKTLRNFCGLDNHKKSVTSLSGFLAEHRTEASLRKLFNKPLFR
jgi:hypothetical protein